MKTKNILLSHHHQAVMQSDWWKAKFLFTLLKDKRVVVGGFELQNISFYCLLGEQFGLHYEQVKGYFRFEFYYN